MRILCVHGVAGHPAGGAWEAGWKDALAEALGTGHDIAFCPLDAPFAATRLSPVQTARALASASAGIASMARRRLSFTCSMSRAKLVTA